MVKWWGAEEIFIFFLLQLNIRLVTICTTYVIKQTQVKVRNNSKPKSVCQQSLYTINLVLLPPIGGGGRGGASVIYSRPRPLRSHAHWGAVPVVSQVCPGRLCLDACVLAWVCPAFEGYPAPLGLTPSGYRRGDRNGTSGLLPASFFFFFFLPLPSLTLLPLPLLPFPFGFVLSYRGRPLSRESGWWERALIAGSWEVWEILLIEVFGDQRLVWNVLFVVGGRARVGRRSSPGD